MSNELADSNNFLLYTSAEGAVKVYLLLQDESIYHQNWLKRASQKPGV